MKELLRKIYNDHSNPAGLASIQKLYRAARVQNPDVRIADVKAFLKASRTYTLHTQSRKRFPRRKILAAKPRAILTCDTATMVSLAKENDGIKYLLVCIDVFSRYLQVVPLKSKNAQASLEGLKQVLESPFSKGYSRLMTDLGGEFYNQPVKLYLKRMGVKLYSVSSREIKASIAERIIRTLKTKIFKYITLNNTLRYIDVLQDIVRAYNETPHKSLGLSQTPNDVHSFTKPSQFIRQFRLMYINDKQRRKTVSPLLNIGDKVRLQSLARTQSVFNKAYYPQNTEEIFSIKDIDTSQPIPLYKLEDLGGEPITGSFYREELTPVTQPETFPVDILKTKLVGGKRKYYVRWRGYPSRFNTWIDAQDLVSL